MQHTFSRLIELVSTLDSLSKDELILLVENLLEIDASGAYKKAIISGIFRHIYHDGCNPKEKDAHLQMLSQAIQKSQSQCTNDKQSHESKFETLPESLLCHIASHLPAKDIFSKWNVVNRKFIRIGLKPESIKHFHFEEQDLDLVQQYPPTFKCDITLSKLESLKIMTSTMGSLADSISTKHLKSLTVGMYSYNN